MNVKSLSRNLMIIFRSPLDYLFYFLFFIFYLLKYLRSNQQAVSQTLPRSDWKQQRNKLCDFSRNVWKTTWFAAFKWSATFFSCWTRHFMFYQLRWQIFRGLNTIEMYFSLWVKLGFGILKFKSQVNGGNQHFGDKIIEIWTGDH